MKRFLVRTFVAFAAALGLAQSAAWAQSALVIKPIAEKKVAELPAGTLFWRVENFPTLVDAQAAAGPMSLAAQAGGKAWLFTLGVRGGATPGGTKVVEVGPLPPVVATQYLLRLNEASGPPGSITPVHTHPGSEAFYVLAGETSSRMPHGVMSTRAGESNPGHGAGVPMQVFSSGTTDLHSLVMFVVDANKPFSSPATMP